ncbi:MAG: N-acetylglucosamine-6-phosphate deacetylase [Streptococcus sp.]
MTYYISAKRFYFEDKIKEGGYLAIVDGRFGDWSENVPEGAEVLDYSDYQIAPGLVDTHIHGFAGYDVMDNSEESLLGMSQALLSAGVTSFLPTALTAPFEELKAICQTTASAADVRSNGAKIQGLFFEGPYFTETYKGRKILNTWAIQVSEQLQGMAGGGSRKIDQIGLAPEREGVADFIKEATKQGVTIALGHSNATYEEAMAAVEAGASVWVHVYNGMRGFTHREPGMVGAAFDSPETIGELIADGHHAVPAACKVLIKQKTPQGVALITDCMSAGGRPDGDYMLGELPVIVEKWCRPSQEKVVT